jgi:hypothetical protein
MYFILQAQAVTLTVSKAFELASDRWNAENENKKIKYMY